MSKAVILKYAKGIFGVKYVMERYKYNTARYIAIDKT